MKINNNKNVKLIVVACRLTTKEYEELQLWKQSKGIPTNSDAIRQSLSTAIKEDKYGS